ncbi:MAG: ABC transporter ATP-binding protein/permease [Ruminococcus sp.]|jgi:ATP-binding cassette subfamily B protein|nr:ABC transporter ATP-binding protein/permease [Ruminococcus sp.]
MFQLKWIWKNLEGNRGIYLIAVICTIIAQAITIISPMIFSQIIDIFIEAPDAVAALDTKRQLLYTLCIAVIAVQIVRSITFFSANMMYEKASQSMLYKIRTAIFANIQRQDMAYYDTNRTGDLMTRLTGDLQSVRHVVAWVGKTLIENIVLFTASTVYFFILDPLMALALLALTPVILTISNVFRKRVGPMYVKLRETFSGLNIRSQENIAGNRVVKAFAREEYEKERFDKVNKEYSDANKNAALVWLHFFPYIESAASGLSVVHLLVGGIFVMIGRLTFGEYIAFSSLIWTLANPMRWIGNLVNDLQRFMASANKVIEAYYARPMIVDRQDAKTDSEYIHGEIDFRNVSFKYSKSNRYALENINLHIKPGMTVAIMGETGSGKTTLVNLIARFYDPTEGEVTVDGINVRFHKLRGLRRKIGTAMQDVILWSDTVEGNIAFSDVNMPQEDVYLYARLSDANGFVEKLPEGYETIIGERGVGLSGGQKQRISLARALAVKPSILILDDTTSAVDLETEAIIQDNLNNHLGYKPTKLIIAQRISSAKDADVIIILSHGKITERGTHDELLKNPDGYYRQIYELQHGTIADESIIAIGGDNFGAE